MKNFRRQGAVFAVLLSLAFATTTAEAQQCQTGMKTLFETTDLSVKDSGWVFFANTMENVFAFDKNGIEKTGSMNMRFRIREIPKKGSYKQVRSEKMMDHRILRNANNDTPPTFDYEGYEKYGYTIVEEEIDGSGRKYKILKKTDYALNGDVLSGAELSPEPPKWEASTGAIPETILIDTFYRTGGERPHQDESVSEKK